jgi:membrane-associated protease RseP (regulator of RpoE activity)
MGLLKGNKMHAVIVMLIAFSMSAFTLSVGAADADVEAREKPQTKLSDGGLLENQNLFSNAFTPSKPSNAKKIQPTEPPKILSGKDQVADYQRMQELGYELLGYSSFKAGHVAPEEVLPQAQKVKAHTVLVYTEKMGGTPASVKIQHMREAKRTGQAPTEQGQTYSYFASFWAKLMPPRFGAHLKVPEEGDTEPGLTVMVVMEGSPAAQAGLQKEDVLLSIGDVEVNTIEALSTAVNRYAGQSVKVVYSRNRQWSEANVLLNP